MGGSAIHNDGRRLTVNVSVGLTVFEGAAWKVHQVHTPLSVQMQRTRYRAFEAADRAVDAAELPSDFRDDC